MANYTRQNEIFGSKGAGSSGDPYIPDVLVGAKQRVYDSVVSQSVTTTSASLSTIPAAATHAEIVCEGASSTDFVRFWPAATAPTSSVGMKLFDGQVYDCAAPSSFRVINGSGTNTLRIAYYHYAASS
jgi:hypothetical protein